VAQKHRETAVATLEAMSMSDFAKQYETMNGEQLLNICVADLMPAALAAFDAELRRRGTPECQRKANEPGFASAQFNVGVAYQQGRGVPLDRAQAAVWYRKAAEQGFASAQLNLGAAYYEGQGVPQDYAQAAVWFRKAAEQGDAAAQFNLGAAYLDGLGVPKDFAEAHFWLNRAVSGKPEGIKLEDVTRMRDDAAARLTHGALTQTQERTGKWLEQHTTDVFPDKKSAIAECARWAELLPKQPSAYRPSGRLPLLGWIVFPTAGLAAGTAAAIVAGTMVAYLAVYLTYFTSLFGQAGDVVFWLFLFWFIPPFICGSPGIAALGVAGVSHSIKNRSVLVEGAVGLLSAATGALILCRWIFPVVASQMPVAHSSFAGGLDLVYVILVLGQRHGTAIPFTLCCMAVSSYLALRTSVKLVKEAKFCEECCEYMKPLQLSFLSLEGAARLANAIKGSSLTKDIATGAGDKGPARLTVFKCDTCKAGYLEAVLTFRAKWYVSKVKNKVKKTEEKWLVASTPVTASQIDEFECACGSVGRAAESDAPVQGQH
jgi:hypothetical protein